MTIDQVLLIKKINEDFSSDASIVVGPETELLMSGLIDSVGLIELVSWIEDELDIEIDPGDIELERFQTPIAIQEFLSANHTSSPSR